MVAIKIIGMFCRSLEWLRGNDLVHSAGDAVQRGADAADLVETCSRMNKYNRNWVVSENNADQIIRCERRRRLRLRRPERKCISVVETKDVMLVRFTCRGTPAAI